MRRGPARTPSKGHHALHRPWLDLARPSFCCQASGDHAGPHPACIAAHMKHRFVVLRNQALRQCKASASLLWGSLWLSRAAHPAQRHTAIPHPGMHAAATRNSAKRADLPTQVAHSSPGYNCKHASLRDIALCFSRAAAVLCVPCACMLPGRLKFRILNSRISLASAASSPPSVG